MNRALGLVGLLVALLPATLAAAGVARASSCRFDEDLRVEICRIDVFTPGAPDDAVPLGFGASRFRWERIFLGVIGPQGSGPGGPSFVGPLCPIREVTTTASDGSITIVTTYGAQYYVELIRLDTGDAVQWSFECVYPGEPAPEPPPPPPSEDEFRERAEPLLTMETELNPREAFGGITGLGTWLWCTDPGVVPVSVSLRGWTASATMEPVGLDWVTGGVAETALAADDCGSEDDPAGVWLPDTQGDYSVEFSSTWAGSWSLSYNGTPFGVFVLGPFDFAAPVVDYPVDEYVGVLDG